MEINCLFRNLIMYRSNQKLSNLLKNWNKPEFLKKLSKKLEKKKTSF